MCLVRAIAFAHCDHPYPGEIRLDVTFFVPDRKRRDRDNLLKNIKDGCNGVAWVDDSQCVTGDTTKKLDKENPRAEVVITYLGEGDFATARGTAWREYISRQLTR